LEEEVEVEEKVGPTVLAMLQDYAPDVALRILAYCLSAKLREDRNPTRALTTIATVIANTFENVVWLKFVDRLKEGLQFLIEKGYE